MEKSNKTKKPAVKPVLLILLASLSAGIGQLFYKQGSISSGDLGIYTILNPFVITGIALYVLATIFMILSFREGELSVLHPFLATSYVWVVLVSAALFESETLTVQQAIGAVVIFLGVSLIGIRSGRSNGN